MVKWVTLLFSFCSFPSLVGFVGPGGTAHSPARSVSQQSGSRGAGAATNRQNVCITQQSFPPPPSPLPPISASSILPSPLICVFLRSPRWRIDSRSPSAPTSVIYSQRAVCCGQLRWSALVVFGNQTDVIVFVPPPKALPTRAPAPSGSVPRNRKKSKEKWIKRASYLQPGGTRVCF